MSYKKGTVHFFSRINSLAVEAETQCPRVMTTRPTNYSINKIKIARYLLKISKIGISFFL